MIFVSVAFSSFTFDYRISHFISGRMSVNPNVLPGLRHDRSYLFRGIPCVFANIFIFLRPSCDRTREAKMRITLGSPLLTPCAGSLRKPLPA